MAESVMGRLYDIQGYSVHDGPGIRTTVYLKGCPLKCLWCHSPESQAFADDLSVFELRCVGTEKCGLCLNVCKMEAVRPGDPERSIQDNSIVTKIRVDREKCAKCFACADVCSAEALKRSGYEMSVSEVVKRVMRDLPFYKEEGGVTISGGEPMAQFEFTLELARRCKEAGITVCLDTTGYAPREYYEKILPYIDLFLYDLKVMDSQKSRNYTGVDVEQILSNAEFIAERGGKFQIRYPVIPKLNSDMENIRKTAEFCMKLGKAVTLVQILPYHKMGMVKYERIGMQYKLTNVEQPEDEFMQSILDIFLEYGLKAQLH